MYVNKDGVALLLARLYFRYFQHSPQTEFDRGYKAVTSFGRLVRWLDTWLDFDMSTYSVKRLWKKTTSTFLKRVHYN